MELAARAWAFEDQGGESAGTGARGDRRRDSVVGMRPAQQPRSLLEPSQVYDLPFLLRSGDGFNSGQTPFRLSLSVEVEDEAEDVL